VADAIFEEFGVVRARSAQELLDIAYVASNRIYPARNTLGVITVSGGAGVLISDAAEEPGVAMPALPENPDELRAILPFAAFRNPVDCTAHIINDTSLLDKFLGAMMRRAITNRSPASLLRSPALPCSEKCWWDELMAIRRAYPDRLFVLVGTVPARCEGGVRSRQCSCFRGCDTRRGRDRGDGPLRRRGSRGRPPRRHRRSPTSRCRGDAVEADAKRLLASCGIPVAEEFATADADAAAAACRQDRLPVVMKILSPTSSTRPRSVAGAWGGRCGRGARQFRSSGGAAAQGASVGPH
jgi:hypothetical protein